MQDVGFLLFLALCWWGAGLCGAGYHFARWHACAGPAADAQRRRHRWRALACSLAGLGAVIVASGSVEYGWWTWPARRPPASTPSSLPGGARIATVAGEAGAPTTGARYPRPRLICGASVGVLRHPARRAPQRGGADDGDVRSTHDGDHPAA